MPWWRRRYRDRDLERELQSHLELTIAEARERGASEEQACYAARRTLGNTTVIKEEMREIWIWGRLERLAQDLRYAGRQLRRNPAFAGAAVLTLALGIGANTAIFSVADGVLLRPLPYPNSNRLVMIWNELSKIRVHQMDLSPTDFDAFRSTPEIFEATAAFNAQDRNLIVPGDSQRVSTIASTPGLLSMLGARTSVGRQFTGEDWKADHDPVAIISHALFVRRFAGNPDAIGATIHLDDRIYRVVGVLSEDFEFGFGAASFDVWTPIPPLKDSRRRQLRMLALMRSGVDLEGAQNFVSATAQHLKETIHPYEGPNGEDAGYRARVILLHDQLLHDFRAGTLVLVGAVALVLLIACVNVANLLLARAMAREKEIAIRRALGASRRRLVRQWLTEACLLTTLGGVAGVAGSVWGVKLIKVLSPLDLPSVARIGVNGRALLFTLAISATACLLFSLAPLFSVLRMTGSLKGPRPLRRMSSLLIAGEVAFALMLLAGSGLLLKSFAQLRQIDPGVRTDHLLTLSVELSAARHPAPRDRIRFFSELQDRLARLPGVISASSTDRLPVFTVGVDTRNGNPFSVDGSRWDPNASALQVAHTGTVGLDYFRTMGIPLIAGRTFSKGDTLDAELVAVTNQTLARRFFAGQDPIGKRILIGAPAPGAPWLTIVGVIGEVRTGALDLPPMPQIYTPLAQDGHSRMFIVLHTVVDPLIMARTVTGIVRKLDPELSPDHVSTMEEHVNKTLGQPRFRTFLLLFFGASALFLAAVGIYGVLAHSVIQRINEIGIRMALGANVGRVTAMVLIRGLRPVAIGILLGFAGTAALTRFLSSVLYQVRPDDPEALGAAALLLSLVAVMACLLPARRAAQVDPMVALRYE